MVSLAELSQMRLDPPEAADPGQFAPPPGSVIGEDSAALFTGAGWRTAKIVAGAAATGLGFAMKHAPRRAPQSPADEQAAMPHDGPEAAAARTGPAPPASDALINLLYRTGREFPGVTAEMHQWLDPAASLQRGRQAAEYAGGRATGGLPGPLTEAISERVPAVHQVARIQVAAPGRYRIDYISGKRQRQPKTIACDGHRRWRVYEDRVAVGPATPLPREIAHLIDPSWLLKGRLFDGADVTVRGRRGFRISAVRNPDSFGPPDTVVFLPAEAVADAEFGILLRLTCYDGGRPMIRFELRDISRHSDPDPGDFRIEVPPGVRTVESSGSVLDEVDAPEAVKVAAKAVIEISRRASAGASALTGFLDAVRGKNPPPPQS